MPRFDLMPSCTGDPVPEDGTGEVQLWIAGSSTLDVTHIASMRLSDAAPASSTTLDFDGDQVLDVVYGFRVADLAVQPPQAWFRFWGKLDDGQVLVGQPGFQWMATSDDADMDGVDDRFGCDRCLGQAGADPSADGCP